MNQPPEVTMADIEGVEGWLEVDEALELRDAARRTALSATEPVVVEIGSWKGRSTIAIAGGLRAAGRGRVFAIDPHEGRAEYPGLVPADTFPEFLANVASRGLTAHVHPLRETSHAGRARFPDRSVHMLFVDGLHDYASVRQEIEDWRPALAGGGHVAFHDFAWPGVGRALREAVLRRGSEFRRPRLVRNTLHVRYLPGAAWTVADSVAALEVRLVIWLRGAAHRGRRFLPARLLQRARVCSELVVNRGS